MADQIKTIEELYEVLESFDWSDYTLEDITELEDRIDGQKDLIQQLKQHRHAFVAGRYRPDFTSKDSGDQLGETAGVQTTVDSSGPTNDETEGD